VKPINLHQVRRLYCFLENFLGAFLTDILWATRSCQSPVVSRSHRYKHIRHQGLGGLGACRLGGLELKRRKMNSKAPSNAIFVTHTSRNAFGKAKPMLSRLSWCCLLSMNSRSTCQASRHKRQRLQSATQLLLGISFETILVND
jgi:hypothetical protein